MLVKNIFIIGLITWVMFSCQDGKENTGTAIEPLQDTIVMASDSLKQDSDSIANIDLWLIGNLEDSFEINFSGKYMDRNTILIYTILKVDVNKSVVLKAFDASGVEIGRSKLQVNNSKDSSEYLLFTFDKKAPLNIAKYYTFQLCSK